MQDLEIASLSANFARRDFARLNKVEQSHLIAGAFHPYRGVKLNRTTNQYGCQIQRYFRKLYIQQFKRMPAKMQLKQKQPPSFDLWTDPLYEKAATVLNANMKMAVTIGVKSGASANDELKPQHVRVIFLGSDPKNSRHVFECTIIRPKGELF